MGRESQDFGQQHKHPSDAWSEPRSSDRRRWEQLTEGSLGSSLREKFLEHLPVWWKCSLFPGKDGTPLQTWMVGMEVVLQMQRTQGYLSTRSPPSFQGSRFSPTLILVSQIYLSWVFEYLGISAILFHLLGTSLVVQWSRICLSMQGMWGRCLDREWTSHMPLGH